MDFVPFVLTAGIIFFLLYWMVKCCCTRRTSQGAVIATPIVITSEVHHVTPGTTQAVPAGAIIQGHSTGTSAYPVTQTGFPALPVQQHSAPFPAQPYMQHYPLQQSGAPAVPTPEHVGAGTVQFPALPPQFEYPAPPMASAPPAGPTVGAAMVNPPSYDQVVSEAYPVQAPYNPNYKG
ncbi:uncharacterized protein LOC128714529 [Anopheles marshallii]|uniref:uncharacterized protein LOC128714529 n=1 Tax=Anopheles marshallii TaxID=1521116 RepID=UPI00237A18E1|nr:uncharacterized protein LOC128714529 [Anopheles marshallii]